MVELLDTAIKEAQIEEQEISEKLKDEKIKANLKKALLNKSELIVIEGKHYKRNNAILAMIKINRKFTCQICGYTLKTASGKKYIEAAHINPKKFNGQESPDNILILCPNHHKEFDLCNPKILLHTEKEVEFKIKNKVYCLDLSIR